MGVAELLAASAAAHQQSTPIKGRPRDMAALQRAADLRAEALALDPDMSDPAWSQGKASHAELTVFYTVQLSRSAEDLNRVRLRARSVSSRRDTVTGRA